MSRRRKQTPAQLPSPWAVALANAESGMMAIQWGAERKFLEDRHENELQLELKKVRARAYMEGRQQEAKDTYEGVGYRFDMWAPKLIPKPGGAPGEMIEQRWGVPQAPRSDTVLDMGSASRQFGKAFSKREDWGIGWPVLRAAALLPVGESIELDFGPTGNERKYHVKAERVKRAAAEAKK